MAGRRRAPIDRRIVPEQPRRRIAPGSPDALPVEFRDAWGEVVQRFDPQQLADLPADLRALLVHAFWEHCATLSPGTRRSAWSALRRFTRFVVDDGSIASARDLDSAALGRYVLWLRAASTAAVRPRAPRGAHAIAFDLLRPILQWCLRNQPGLLPPDLEIPRNPFPARRGQGEPRRRLPADQLKAILRACYAEIDEIWARFRHGQAIIRQPELPPKSLRGEGLARWIWRISRIEGGLMPDTATLDRNGVKPSTLVRFWGGHGIMAQHFHITTDSLVPFFLAIAIQTAANPEPLRLIRRDCLVPHPLDEHRIIIDWCKPKTSLRLKRAQRRSFDRRRRHAAPNLVEMMLALTEPIVAHAPPGQRDRLFLTRSVYEKLAHRTRRGRVEVIEPSVLARAIGRFVLRANRRIDAWNAAHPDDPQARIERFAPVLLRGSVATAHYRASGGDVLVAQSILNHASAATTETYIRSAETTRLQRRTIARLQDLMLAWIQGPRPAVADQGLAMPRATAPFGHDCLAPLVAGPDGTPRLCSRFGGCLSCPGLVIPIDAEHLARILLAIGRLEAARERLDPRRWQLLYAPTYQVMTQELIADFPAEMFGAARALAATMPALPELE